MAAAPQQEGLGGKEPPRKRWWAWGAAAPQGRMRIEMRPMLRNGASGPDIGLPGAGFRPDSSWDRLKIGFRPALQNPAEIRPGNPISSPEAL